MNHYRDFHGSSVLTFVFYCFFIQIVCFPRLTETGKKEHGTGEVEHGTEEHRTVKHGTEKR